LLVVIGVVSAVVTLFYVATAIVYRDARKAALVVSAFLLLFQTYDSVAATVESHGLPSVAGRFLLLLAYALLAAFAVTIYRTRRRLDIVSGLATAVTAGMLLIPVATVAPTYLITRVAANGPTTEAPRGEAPATPPPDIYYLIFDRYGDERTIRESYGFDNEEFYRYLTDKGFYIARHSHGNYIKTALSVASSLNLTMLDGVASQTPDSTDWGAVYELLANHQLGRFLTAHGYSYVHAGSWWWPTHTNRGATRNINSYPFTPRPLMVMLDSRFVSPFTRRTGSPWLDDRRQQWSRVNRDIAELAQVPPQTGPKFVFAHVLVPHPPYTFNRDGSFLTASDANRYDDRESYVNQLIATNQKIALLVDRILADSPRPPIIVLQGDEGPYPVGTRKDAFNWHHATPPQLLDKSGILNAYYFPDRDVHDLYASITPVNSFRIILNRYFGTALPLLPDRTYAHESDFHVYRLVDITDVVSKD
jgi:hypothetical protein